ncbi:deoxyuridine 5'-triphosphate nucleotidohydrolase-like [Hydra vulgaris]|uniref:Deoxyuridine 5'-triphosphate nucleotidohydrolase n=1 Tax=Hydra vulgaris TaxID=6087 RepID=A0ABM4BV56_HYDVU
MCLDCKKMEKEENSSYERTRMEIVKLKYKHFDSNTEFTGVPFLPYINELFNRPLNENNLKQDIQEWSFYETKESACFDLRSTKDYILQPQQRVLVSTGVYIDKIDTNLAGHVYSKSGIAYKYGVVVLNSPGIIDADYKDEIKVLLMNLSKENYIIKHGDAVAQMGFVKMFKAIKNVIEINGCSCRQVKMSMIKDVERKGGFGSTGK